LIPPTEDEQVRWGPDRAYQQGAMIIHPMEEAGEVTDRLLVARADLVTGTRFDPAHWEPFDRHDYAIFNPVHTWIEFINRLLGAFAAVPLVALACIGLAVGLRGGGWRPAVWSLLALGQLGVVGFLGREVVLGNLVPGSITIHMAAAFGLSAVVLVALSVERSGPIWSKAQIGLLALTLIAVLAQVGVGTQVREAVDLLDRSGVPRSDWISDLGDIYIVHRLLSWLVLGLVLSWLVVAFRAGYRSWTAWACGLLLGVQIVGGLLLAYCGFPAILQPIHLVAALMLAGVIWWQLVRGPVVHLAQ
jgi:cytochrome c oxidase assembly protein subunit 15